MTKLGKEKSGQSQEEIISTLKPNDFLGEIALVEKTSFARTASAYANSESELIGFFKPDLLEIIQRNPRLGVKIIMRISEIIADRLRSTTSTLSEKSKELEQLRGSLNENNAQPTF